MKMRRRLIFFYCAALFIFGLIIVRLFYIQIIKGEEYKQAAIRQRTIEIKLKPSRGMIFDRNLIPLTNKNKIKTMFIFRNMYSEKELSKILKILDSKNSIEKYKILSNGNIIEIPLDKEADDLKKIENLKGIYVKDKIKRYDGENVLSHVIGYVNKSENKGQSGIERAFDNILKLEDSYGKSALVVDGRKNLIPGIGMIDVLKKRNEKATGIKLTIDYNIQKIVERVMDSEKKNGAVIVADVKSGDILAMVSRPNFDQENVVKYFNSDNMELYNKAVQVAYPPGSLFKIIVLAAALESGKVDLDKKYFCKGYEEIGNIKIACHSHKTGGHGEINLEEAFYNSCNSVFIQIGKIVGAKNIIQIAKKFGFGELINIGLLEEVKGNLPEGNDILGPAIGNISIGQGSIEVTPLQITNMIVTIANNGIMKDMSIVDSLVTEDGRVIKKIKRDKPKRILNSYYAKLIRRYMEKVVTMGTAKNISMEEIGGAAGKTGSAQAVYNKRETIHAWFAGYFPKDNPKYAITVLIENGISGGKTAAPIFEKIAKEIEKIE
ncbi:penicillin-binding protein 2 [Caloranaerobacter azorensis DSM 13643]|uniref:Penicillin-binding protein 2 n=1 Tax=Caloranaerobacter azorensis DSM 13643 TaxID=1121264 RepID=A0A1M5RVW9_9FIRM|nr:penicillin-binding transpeptidase domain-containing protein [Caloranaerobacter azorensis]SHH30301.1 penicillin-binding protein 2 [Caloranaerobacter azorensis DSM 13643]